MKIKGAMTVLNRRAQFYGKTLDWLIDAMDNHMDENMTVTPVSYTHLTLPTN